MEYLVIAIIIVLLVCIYYYNQLTSAKQNSHEAWSGIEVQLKRRHDLIPNLVETVKGYAKHEKKLFETVTKERNKALMLPKSDLDQLSKIEAEIELAIKSIFMVAEAYPVLKANENFLKLQTELSETEDQIASARRIYNSNVADYNILVKNFPSNIIAGLSNFMPLAYYE